MATCPASTRTTRAGNGARTGACLAPLLRHRAPGGESLRDTGARVWPYYLHDMQPRVLAAPRCWLRPTAIPCARSSWRWTDSRATNRQAGTRHRRADRLYAQRRFDRSSKEVLPIDGRPAPLRRQGRQSWSALKKAR